MGACVVGQAEAEMSLTVVGVVEVAEGRVVTPAVRRVVPRGHALKAQPDSEPLKAFWLRVSGRLFSQHPTCPADSSACQTGGGERAKAGAALTTWCVE